MRRLQILILGIFLAFFASFSPSYAAMDLTEAKKSGLVGERWDGMLGIVSGGSSQEVKDLVNEVNKERLVRYEQLARENNKVDVDQVKLFVGKKLIDKTPSGYFVQYKGSPWTKK